MSASPGHARQVIIRGLDFQSMLKFAKTLRLLLATILSLWVAGAGCMLGCEGMIASAASGGSAESAHHPDKSPIVVASGHACSSGAANKSHDLSNKRAASVEPTTPATHSAESLLQLNGSSSNTMNGCPLAMSRAAVVAKVRGSDFHAAPVLVQSILRDLNSMERTAPLSSPLRLPNRGHTYLHCCVFLI